MNRLGAGVVMVVALVGILISTAATNTKPLPQESGFSGKAVIVEREGWSACQTANDSLYSSAQHNSYISVNHQLC